MRLKKRKIAKLWKDGLIPARIFFEILSSQNLKLLKKEHGYAKKGDLKRAWSKIYDEYFVLKDDLKLAQIINTQANIIQMVRQIEVTRQAVYAICKVPFNKEQLKELVDGIKAQGFSFDIQNPLDSVTKILKEEIPSIETRIEIEKDNLKSLTDNVVTTFEDNCVGFEGWGYKVDENCSLRKYVSYEKAVIKKAQKQKSNGKR